MHALLRVFIAFACSQLKKKKKKKEKKGETREADKL